MTSSNNERQPTQSKAGLSRFHIEKLEERIAPSHRPGHTPPGQDPWHCPRGWWDPYGYNYGCSNPGGGPSH